MFPPSALSAGSPSVPNQAAVSPSSAFSPSVAANEAPMKQKIPAASQAAVSQLVRKELEKSLAQIEFPKPPPQDIYFLPSTNNSEFLMCLGLEEVVKCVQEHLNNKHLKQEIKEQQQLQQQQVNEDTKQPNANIIEIKYEYPVYCAQCMTDFSPVWRQDKNGINMCEKCLKNLEKKQIKTEHNARLKQAFLKAVKDKEIFEKQLIAEQQQRQPRISNGASNPHLSANSSNNNGHQLRGQTPSGTHKQMTFNPSNNSNNRGFSSPQANAQQLPNTTTTTNNSNNIASQRQHQHLQHQQQQQRRSLQNPTQKQSTNSSNHQLKTANNLLNNHHMSATNNTSNNAVKTNNNRPANLSNKLFFNNCTANHKNQENFLKKLSNYFKIRQV